MMNNGRLYSQFHPKQVLANFLKNFVNMQCAFNNCELNDARMDGYGFLLLDPPSEYLYFALVVCTCTITLVGSLCYFFSPVLFNEQNMKV